jgi:hypothetical protein
MPVHARAIPMCVRGAVPRGGVEVEPLGDPPWTSAIAAVSLNSPASSIEEPATASRTMGRVHPPVAPDLDLMITGLELAGKNPTQSGFIKRCTRTPVTTWEARRPRST